MNTSYRRRTRDRNYSSRRQAPVTDWRATMLMQCIVSGLVLCLLLIISLVNTKFTNDLQSNLKNAISSSTSFDEVRENAAEATNTFLNVQGDFKSLLDGEGETPQEAENDIVPLSDESPSDPEEEGSFRIDEDILEEMGNKEDAYSKDFF